MIFSKLRHFFQQSARVRTRVEIPLRKNRFATFCSFENLADPREHVAVTFTGGNTSEPPLVRIHSECLTGDVFGSQRCDCGEQLNEAIDRFSTEGGILLYLRQEGRGIGLYRKLDAYALQLKGQDTYEANQSLGLGADLRDYTVAAQMLRALGVGEIRLLTNNPDKAIQLVKHGIKVVSTVNTGVFLNKQNKNYLRAKARKKGHSIRPFQLP